MLWLRDSWVKSNSSNSVESIVDYYRVIQTVRGKEYQHTMVIKI